MAVELKWKHFEINIQKLDEDIVALSHCSCLVPGCFSSKYFRSVFTTLSFLDPFLLLLSISLYPAVKWLCCVSVCAGCGGTVPAGCWGVSRGSHGFQPRDPRCQRDMSCMTPWQRRWRYVTDWDDNYMDINGAIMVCILVLAMSVSLLPSTVHTCAYLC